MNALTATRLSAALPTTWQPGWTWLALGGLTAGTLDLVAATLYWTWGGFEPVRTIRVILQAIASWVLGREQAIAGGWATAVAGGLLHYSLMIAMVAGFYAASGRWPGLLYRPLRSGVVYGAFLYVLMFVILVPNFSAVQAHKTLPPSWTATCFLAYVLLVGVPCALFARAARR